MKKENNFNVWIVADKNIPYQQNLSNLHALSLYLMFIEIR